MATETEKVIIETEVKLGNSGNSIKSVKSELRSLQNEMAALEPGSKAFTTAAIRAGELKDKIDDARMAVAAFNPEAKFQAFANVIGGVANGFAAAQGAMAIFGADSKDLEKVMVKTQGAIALATGLNGLLGMKDQLVVMASVIKTTVVSAFATMRAAIISTGILGLVILIGTLIYSWYEEKKANDAATEALKKYDEENQRIADEKRKTAINATEGRQKELLDIQNKANEEIKALYEKVKKEEITQREANETAKEINERLEYDIAKTKKKFRDEDNKKAKESADKRKAELKTQQKEAKDDYEFYTNLSKKIKDKEAENERERLKSLRTARIEAAAEEIRLADEVAQAKIDTLNTTANALSGFAQLAGEQTAIGKALGIATTTIDTYVAAQAAFKSGSAINPALGYLAAAGAIAAGFARVRAIMAVQIPNTSMGATMPSMPGTSAAPPIIRPTSSTVNIGNQNAIRTTNANKQDGKVYVLESDITGTQQKVENIRAKTIIK